MYGDCELSRRVKVDTARNSSIVTAHLVQQDAHCVQLFLRLRNLEKETSVATFQMAVSHLLIDLKY